MSAFQPMPDLADDQLDALRADIAAHGILVPVVVDQHDRILDGHNRAAIAAELGIECPRVVHEVVDDDAAMDLAVSLNCARRHLNQEQRRDLIRHELTRRPGDSDRAVARRVGCSPTTVGSVRVSKLDTPPEFAAALGAGLHKARPEESHRDRSIRLMQVARSHAEALLDKGRPEEIEKVRDWFVDEVDSGEVSDA